MANHPIIHIVNIATLRGFHSGYKTLFVRQISRSQRQGDISDKWHDTKARPTKMLVPELKCGARSNGIIWMLHTPEATPSATTGHNGGTLGHCAHIKKSAFRARPLTISNSSVMTEYNFKSAFFPDVVRSLLHASHMAGTHILLEHEGPCGGDRAT